jgi:hypothetical protein
MTGAHLSLVEMGGSLKLFVLAGLELPSS